MWRQRWHDLLFYHWPVPAAALRHLVPASLDIDTFDGEAWIGLVPFRMTDVTLRGWPALPWLSAFKEMNLRTYVTDGQKPGVWFLRMDASRALAVWAARWSLGLPYVWSRMALREAGAEVRYSVSRAAAAFQATYGPVGPPYLAASGRRDAWLTERYCLYCQHGGHLLRVEIHHAPWALQPAAVDIHANTIAMVTGVPAPPDRPLLHFARFQDVIGWGAESLGRISSSSRSNAAGGGQ